MKDKKLTNLSLMLKPHNVLQYIALLSGIYASATPINSTNYIGTVLVYLLTTLVLFLFVKINKLAVSNRKTLFLLVFSGLIFITLVVNGDNDINFYLGIIIQILSSYLLVESIPFNDFKKAYIKIFTIIGVYSIILTLYFNIYRESVNALQAMYMGDIQLIRWRNFYNIYFIWDLYARHGIIRNSGCFREPGVFGSFLSIALVLKIIDVKSYKSKNHIDYIQLIILTIAVFSTLSTTAVLCLVMSAAIYFLDGKVDRKKVIALLLISSATIIFLLKFGSLLFSKFNSSNTSYIALYERIEGVGSMIKSWLINPLFGAGYTRYYEIVTKGANTISFLVILGEFGILLLALLLYALFKFVKLQRISTFATLCLMIQFIIILNTQYLILMPLMIIIMFYGISTINKKYH